MASLECSRVQLWRNDDRPSATAVMPRPGLSRFCSMWRRNRPPDSTPNWEIIGKCRAHARARKLELAWMKSFDSVMRMAGQVTGRPMPQQRLMLAVEDVADR